MEGEYNPYFNIVIILHVLQDTPRSVVDKYLQIQHCIMFAIGCKTSNVRVTFIGKNGKKSFVIQQAGLSAEVVSMIVLMFNSL